jgi:predicted PP-loop superfamily ATPase
MSKIQQLSEFKLDTGVEDEERDYERLSEIDDDEFAYADEGGQPSAASVDIDTLGVSQSFVAVQLIETRQLEDPKAAVVEEHDYIVEELSDEEI